MNHPVIPSPTFDLEYPSIPPHLRVAISQIGLYEYAGDLSNPIIEQYLSSVDIHGKDNIPWCSAFVNWCLQEAGMVRTRSGLARSFLSWGQEVKHPYIGDIVVIKRGVSKTKGHVGFYMDHHKGWVYILGGNQNDRVGVNAYSSLRLLSYRRAL